MVSCQQRFYQKVLRLITLNSRGQQQSQLLIITFHISLKLCKAVEF